MTPALETRKHSSTAAGVWSLIIAHDRWVVFAIAILAALVWYSSEPIVFTNDSFGYVAASKYLAGVSARGVPYYRMPLYPVFLVVTGAKLQHIFWLVLATAGIAIVVVFHDGFAAIHDGALRQRLAATGSIRLFKIGYDRAALSVGIDSLSSSTLITFQTGSRFGGTCWGVILDDADRVKGFHQPSRFHLLFSGRNSTSRSWPLQLWLPRHAFVIRRVRIMIIPLALREHRFPIDRANICSWCRTSIKRYFGWNCAAGQRPGFGDSFYAH